MKIDLSKTLVRRCNARRAADNSALSEHIPQMYRKAANHFEVVLGLAAVRERKAAQELDGQRSQTAENDPISIPGR